MNERIERLLIWIVFVLFISWIVICATSCKTTKRVVTTVDTTRIEKKKDIVETESNIVGKSLISGESLEFEFDFADEILPTFGEVADFLGIGNNSKKDAKVKSVKVKSSNLRQENNINVQTNVESKKTSETKEKGEITTNEKQTKKTELIWTAIITAIVLILIGVFAKWRKR